MAKNRRDIDGALWVRGMPLPALHRCKKQVVSKTVNAEGLSFRGAKRRGALSAKREEVPLGCNLGKAVTISPMALLLSDRILRDCHGPFGASQ